jgi:hypothetical protein
MPSYLVELYLPRVGSLAAAAEDARRAEELGGDGLRYVRTYFVAEDETCFHVFEASSRDAVVEAASRAGLRDARVTEAVEDVPGRGDGAG